MRDDIDILIAELEAALRTADALGEEMTARLLRMALIHLAESIQTDRGSDAMLRQDPPATEIVEWPRVPPRSRLPRPARRRRA